jgi:large subunit ribosomal protein L21
MYAVIKNGGNQHRVSPGDTIRVQLIDQAEKEINLEDVLLVSKDENVSVGNPFVKGALVKAEIQGNEKGPKDLIFKKKPRKGYKKLRGHRQNYTVLKITDIVFGG